MHLINFPNTVIPSRGFTLIELLVVIAIIGIIASTMMASLVTVRQDARDARRFSDVNQIMIALELYYSDVGRFPEGNGVEESHDGDFLDDLIDGGYLPSMPTDPIGDSTYFYEYSSFKNTPGGPCCQIAYIGIYTEKELETGDCPFSGRRVNDHHCHIFYPGPLNCSDPYNQGYPADCTALRD
ncbi:MAG: prepilin-type N-terminal cleavage/methylation domain-containing protein [Candidatus Paceibacterota bacterium]